MVGTSGTPPQLPPPPEDTAQPHPYPLVQWREGSLMTMLEVLEPAPQRLVYRLDDDLQALPLVPARFTSDRSSQFGHTLAPRPAIPTFEVVSKKVKAAPLGGINYLGLFRMQAQTGICRPLLQLCECSPGSASLRQRMTRSSA